VQDDCGRTALFLPTLPQQPEPVNVTEGYPTLVERFSSFTDRYLLHTSFARLEWSQQIEREAAAVR
jgi:hypothetical protein